VRSLGWAGWKVDRVCVWRRLSKTCCLGRVWRLAIAVPPLLCIRLHFPCCAGTPYLLIFFYFLFSSPSLWLNRCMPRLSPFPYLVYSRVAPEGGMCSCAVVWVRGRWRTAPRLNYLPAAHLPPFPYGSGSGNRRRDVSISVWDVFICAAVRDISSSITLYRQTSYAPFSDIKVCLSRADVTACRQRFVWRLFDDVG